MKRVEDYTYKILQKQILEAISKPVKETEQKKKKPSIGGQQILGNLLRAATSYARFYIDLAAACLSKCSIDG